MRLRVVLNVNIGILDLKVKLVSLNYAPELTGIGKYNGEMCPWFVNAGDCVSVICAPPYYPEWSVLTGYSKYMYKTESVDGVSVTRCPVFVPKELSTFKRLIHLSSFALSSAIVLITRLFRSPDVVVVVEPTLFSVPAVLIYCKLTNTRSVLHIQDYEIDAMFGLGMAGKPGLLAQCAFFVERFLMRRFDVVSSISYSMLGKAREKGVGEESLIFFPNWSDTDFVHPGVDGSALRESWGVKSGEKVVLYAGNIGAKQGLELVVEAAQRYLDRSEVRFFMVGAGAYVGDLKALCISKGVSNIEFKPLQEWKDVPAMLALADVHLVVQKKGAADAVLPSKLTNILSIGGNTVVTAESHTELGRLAEKYPGIFSCVEPEDLDAFCSGLEIELQKSGINKVARSFAEQNLNKEAILSRFRKDLLVLSGKSDSVNFHS